MYCTFLIPCAACIQEFVHASPHLDNLDLCAFMAVMVSQSIFLLPLLLWSSNCTIGWTGGNTCIHMFEQSSVAIGM